MRGQMATLKQVPRPTATAALVALAAAVLGLLVLATFAQAQIVPQKGIMGINLKMTRAQVIAAKGKPDAERLAPHDIIGMVRTMRYGRTHVTFGGRRPDAGVIGVLTKDPRQRTPGGVGIGSAAADVRNGVPDTRCRTEFGISHCWKGSFYAAGNRVTDFILDKPGGRVVSVTVGFVID